jgi:DNA-binding LacI/PurR family transcriptional regulator
MRQTKSDSLRKESKPVTLADIAAMAMVSNQTVSRVINNHANVSAKTRARVLAAVNQLGYRPNNAARALVTGNSKMLGLLALDMPSMSGLASQYAIERSARDNGYYITIATMDEIRPSSFLHAVEWLRRQAVDGLLVVAPTYDANEALEKIADELPLVVIEGDPDSPFATVSVDQVSGAKAATEHLLSLGHQSVFHVGGPTGWRQTDERILGWRLALESYGVDAPMPLSGDWSAKSGYELGQTLAMIPELTAIFVAADRMAFGAIRAFAEKGRRVPHDVAIVGFDDIPEAAFYCPPLSTVRQDFQEVGARALELLLMQIESGKRSDINVTIGCDLIVRESSLPQPYDFEDRTDRL